MSNATITRTPYRFSQNGVGDSNDFGNHILKRGAGSIRRPSWNRTETVVRFLPQWNFDANGWEPFRCSPAPMDFGDWIRKYEAVRGFGSNGITMLLYDPIATPAYDVQTNPLVILYRAIDSAIKNRQCEPDWPALFLGAPGKRAQLSRHAPIYIARCGIFRINNKDMATSERSPLGLSTGDPAFFLELSRTAGEKLIAYLEEKKDDWQGDPDDLDSYKFGDIISLDKGAFVHFFQEGADPRTMQAVQSSAPRQLVVNTGMRSSSSGSSNFQSYDLFITTEFNGFSAALNSPDLERLIKSKQRSWEDCLQFYSHVEQAHLIQDGFPASAILYAWRDHPEWIKDETRGKAVNRVTAGMDVRSRDSVQPQPQAQKPVPVYKPALTQGSGIGAWGNQASSDEDSPVKDNVVPDLDDSDVTTKATQALQEARERMNRKQS